MSDTTPNLSMPYIAPSQAQKHVTHNEALRLLDMLVQLSVTSRDAAAPPAAGVGERFIVGPGASGAWAGRETEIAHYGETGWEFVTPGEGMLAFVRDAAELVVFAASGWQPVRPNLGTDDLQNLPGVGVNASPDQTNRLAVSAPATLLSHEGGGHQLKINRNGPTDTASLLFQSGWVGHAEMGLSGTGDFSVKVSDDGAGWVTALTADAATGRVHFPAGGAREVLDGPRTWHVDPAQGSDANDGLAAGAGAFASLQRAVEAALGVDAGGHDLTIQLAGGVHTLGGPVVLRRAPVGADGLRITGDPAAPSDVVLDGETGVIECAAGLTELSGVTLQNASASDFGVSVGPGARLRFADVVFGAGGAGHVRVRGGHCEASGDYEIVGGAASHLTLEGNGRLGLEGRSVTLTGVPDFASAFLSARGGSHAELAGSVFNGTATGQRYAVTLNASADTGGAGESHLPGDTAGTVSGGGVYA